MDVKDGLKKLREPFKENQISKLPKPTKKQTDEVKADYRKGARCLACGGWHHPSAVHLDYVGHAALTDRLLDVDQEWTWEPLSTNEVGQPVFDANNGLWIKLTVCGVTRLGYGAADGKNGGDAIKEVIGDALRNAAMRFGAALDLWHKGELHPTETQKAPAPTKKAPVKAEPDPPIEDGEFFDGEHSEQPPVSTPDYEFFCEKCNAGVSKKVCDYSMNNFKKVLCYNCQKGGRK